MTGREWRLARLGLLDTAAWLAGSLAVGAVAARIPVDRFSADGFLTRPRPFENGGHLWERVGVRRWKDRLPDAGGVFGGGPAKGHLGTSRRWQHLAAETRRAELVHWTLLALTPLLGLANPPTLALVVVAGAVAANVPCIITQRYNRARALRLAGLGR